MNWGRRSQRLTTFVTFDLSACIQARLTLLSAGHSCPTAAPQAGPRPQRTLPSQVAFPCSRTFHHSHCLRGKKANVLFAFKTLDEQPVFPASTPTFAFREAHTPATGRTPPLFPASAGVVYANRNEALLHIKPLKSHHPWRLSSNASFSSGHVPLP